MSDPSNRYEDTIYSVIEDLDPEPQREPGGGIRFDLLVGIPLILAVILFAGWQWWRQDYTADRYRAGQEAAGRNDWASAADYFAEASGYSDADAQASGAREKIEERDRLYAAIVSNSAEGNWLPVLRDTREAAKIQPDYRDLPEREQTARDNIYNSVLSGTIALRVNANPAGLYYRADKRWIYLQGSDMYSAPRLNPIGGQVIYDAPDPGWLPPIDPVPKFGVEVSLRGRHLVRARYTGGEHIDYITLSLDPSQYTRLLSSKEGIWGLHFGNGGLGSYSPEASVVRNFYANTEIAYQPFNSDTIGYAPLPPSSSNLANIVELDPNSNRYLIAEWNETGPQGPTETTIVDLYLGVAGSNAKRLIYTHNGGGIISAQFDDTGRYVMVHTFDARELAVDEKQSIVLIDLEAAHAVTGGEPVARATVLRTASVSATGSASGQSWLGSTFVPTGPFKGDIVLIQFKGRDTSVQVIAPVFVQDASEDSSSVIAEANVGGSVLRNWLIDGDEVGAMRVIGFDFTSRDTLTSTLDTAIISAGGKVETQSFVVPTTAYPMTTRRSPYGYAWSSYKYVPNVMPSENNVYISVYSASGSQLTGGIISPTLSYSQGLQHTQLNDPKVVPSIVLGDRFFAYTYDTNLHLHSYDGKDDLILESGVQSLYEQIQNRAPWTYVR